MHCWGAGPSLQCCEISLWLRGSKESSNEEEEGRPCQCCPLQNSVAPAAQAQLSCFLFSLCGPIRIGRTKREESRRPRVGRCCKGFIGTAAAAAAVQCEGATAAAAKAEILVHSSAAQLSAGHTADCQDRSTCTLINSDQCWSTNLYSDQRWSTIHLASAGCHPSESSKCEMCCWIEVRCKDMFPKKLLCPVVANVLTKSANKTWSVKKQNRKHITKHFWKT